MGAASKKNVCIVLLDRLRQSTPSRRRRKMSECFVTHTHTHTSETIPFFAPRNRVIIVRRKRSCPFFAMLQAAPLRNQYVKIFRALQLHSTTPSFSFWCSEEMRKKTGEKKQQASEPKTEIWLVHQFGIVWFYYFGECAHTLEIVHSQKLYFTEPSEWNPHRYIPSVV